MYFAHIPLSNLQSYMHRDIYLFIFWFNVRETRFYVLSLFSRTWLNLMVVKSRTIFVFSLKNTAEALSVKFNPYLHPCWIVVSVSYSIAQGQLYSRRNYFDAEEPSFIPK